MATAGYKTRILIGDTSFTSKLTEASNQAAVEMLDITTYGDDGVKRFLPGLGSGEFSVSGFMDETVIGEAAAWTSATPITFAPFGLSHGSPVILVNALRANFEPGSSVAGVSSFDIGATVDGYNDIRGRSLHDLTAVTADEDGTSQDWLLSSAQGGSVHLHVTAFSGLTQAVVKIQDSADNSSWADIATFATVTGATAERIELSGSIRRYTRYTVDVTGTGSITFQTSLGRR